MPRASDTVATMAKTGVCASSLTPCRTSWIKRSIHWRLKSGYGATKDSASSRGRLLSIGRQGLRILSRPGSKPERAGLSARPYGNKRHGAKNDEEQGRRTKTDEK